MSNHLRICIAQLNLKVGDVSGNTQKIISSAEEARDEHNADLVLFPELTLTGYPPEDLLLRPGLQKRVNEALEQLKAVNGIAMVVGYTQQTEAGLFNAAGLIDGGEIKAVYHKQRLPNYSVFDEVRYFQSGDSATVYEFKGVKLAFSICEDIWHEGIMAQAAEAGAQLMLNLNASPFHAGKWQDREHVLKKRVQEAAMPIVYCNLVGGQDELVFDGQSFVMDANGNVAQRAPAYEAGLYLVEFETAEGVTPIPTLCHEPQPLEASIYNAIVLGVRDYINKSGFDGAVIGLSGGVDSALVLAIACDAIGADKVEGVRMPSRYTVDMSLEDAELEAKAFGADCGTIGIEPAFNTFLDMLSDEFAGMKADTTEENIQARCRGIILMAISNKKRKIVLTTGNKSEMAVGYCTLYGDMAGGYAPIKDVPKTMVYRLCDYRNSISPVIPQRVLDRPPSAELAPDQKDEDSLPPYEVLDPILEMYIEQDMCAEEIVAAGYKEEDVARAVHLTILNEYKRRQAPPGVRITRRAFGRDRRYPIVSGYK